MSGSADRPHGAVSEEIAGAMAEGALANSAAHVALSTTGIAGPGGAVPGKPVGTVCFGWSAQWGHPYRTAGVCRRPAGGAPADR